MLGTSNKRFSLENDHSKTSQAESDRVL